VPGPDPARKRRTRAHVIASQSRSYVEWFVVQEGYTSKSFEEDYGYDLFVTTYDEEGYIEDGQILVQLKATDNPARTPKGIAVTLDVRDYELWTRELMPVFLVVYDGVNQKAYWLYVQHYFQVGSARRPKPGAKTVRVFVPEKNKVGPAFVQYARGRKAAVQKQLAEGIKHDG
jgi:hypothetical protein